MNGHLLKKLLLAALTCALLTFSGCSLAYGDSLLALPKLPGEYVQIQQELDDILESGSTYAVAETGANRQTVQLVDLDGDGREEALAFFRTADGTYQVYAFRQTDKGFERFDMAEGYGNTLRSISYPKCGPDGQLAIALSWGFDDTIYYGMTVLRLTANGFENMLDLSYAGALIEDFDGNGADELAFAVRDSVTGLYSARVYRYQNSEYAQIIEVGMCLEVKSVASMQYSLLEDGNRALFIDSQSISGGYVTDVISYDGSTAGNETIDPASGSGSATWRPISVFSADINGDGALDVPVGRSGDTEARNRLSWCAFADGVAVETVGSTYHSPTEAWYLLWPEQWGEAVESVKTNGNGMTKTTFSVILPPPADPDEERKEQRSALLSIWVFTGDNREEHMQLYPGLHLLRSTVSAIYGYTLVENDFPAYALTDEQVGALFHTIETNWQSEVS